MLLSIIRVIFVCVVAGLGVRLVQLPGEGRNPWVLWVLFGGVIFTSVAVLFLDIFTPRKRIQTISAIYFGLIVGLFLGYLVQIAIEPALNQPSVTQYLPDNAQKVLMGVVTVVICYACVSTLLQTKDDFRFIIPYMEFSKEVKGTRPLVLDTSVVID
jgi:uncharacterized protein YacL